MSPMPYLTPPGVPVSIPGNLRSSGGMMFSIDLAHAIHKRERPLYFLHLPKCAGSSFRIILDRHFEPPEICPVVHWKDFVVLPPQEIQRYRLFHGHFDYHTDGLLPASSVIITMLRDPVERTISMYYFWRKEAQRLQQEKLPIPYEYQQAMAISLADFVTHPQEQVSRDVQNGQTYRVEHTLRVPRPGLTEQDILERAIEHLEAMPFVGLTDEFNRSLDLLTYHLGWPAAQAVEYNVTPNRPRQQEIDEHTLATIREANRLDSQLVRYARRRFEAEHDEMMRVLLAAHRHRVLQFIDEHKTLDLLEQTFGRGWYKREASQPAGTRTQQYHRWTGPETESVIFAVLPRHVSLRLEAHVFNPFDASIIESLTLHLDERPIPLTLRSERGSQRILQGHIDATTVRQPVSKLTFRVQRTQRPPASDDQRLLGLAFRRLHITPLFD